jgi:negative regulator of flagellin synthesis FlgM
MKIDQPSENRIPASTVAQPPLAKAGHNTGSPAATVAARSAQSAGVAVTVSNLARTLGANQAGDTADVDTKKVNSVRASIQQGTYVVNPEVIADKLLANAHEMLNRSRG